MFGLVGMLGVVFPRSALRHAPICSMSKPLSVGVIGGGVAGVTAARCLAEAGVDVVLHEREPQLGGRLGTVKVAGRSAGRSGLLLHQGQGPRLRGAARALGAGGPGGGVAHRAPAHRDGAWRVGAAAHQWRGGQSVGLASLGPPVPPLTWAWGWHRWGWHRWRGAGLLSALESPGRVSCTAARMPRGVAAPQRRRPVGRPVASLPAQPQLGRVRCCRLPLGHQQATRWAWLPLTTPHYPSLPLTTPPSHTRRGRALVCRPA
eukprot:scaffold24005_cov59-Phaeocystis_antarctica.AAC.6